MPLLRYTVYPKKYAHGFVALCFVVVMQSFIMNSHEVFIHIHQGCFAGTGAIVRLPQCQWSKPDGYGKISQCITTTKHSKAKTVCIFLGIYCNDKTCYKVDGDVHCTLGKMWKWDNWKLVYYRRGNPALAAVVLLPVLNYLCFKFYNASKSSMRLCLWRIEQLGKWYKEYANCRGGRQTWASLH